MPLTAAQRKSLKARAHALQPVVLIGGNGLTEAVLKEIDASLKAHELIKVHVAGEDKQTRELLQAEICGQVSAEPVQAIGRMLVIYRENPASGAQGSKASSRRRTPRQTKRSFQGHE